MKRMRILCVDDEPNILEGLRVHLGRSFDMTTAQGGDAALEAIVQEGPFAVIVTDFRMPGMNGIEFLQAAKPLAPDSSFIMLTGNHDLECAIQAVNEGQVFRFLNKPCPSRVLKLVLDEGIAKYQYLIEKREVLNETFVGAIRLMTEVMEMSYPEVFSRASAVESIVSQLCESLRIEERWEIKLATRLCRLGAALIEHVPQESSMETVTQNWIWEANVGKLLIRHVPRLELVSEIVGLFGTADGAIQTMFDKDEELVPIAAAIIRSAWFLEYQFRRGSTPTEATKGLMQLMPAASSMLLEAARSIQPPKPFPEKDAVVRSMTAQELKPGMVLAEKVSIKDALTLEAGHKLSEPMICRIVQLAGSAACSFQAVVQ